jgi:hypothetical protein
MFNLKFKSLGFLYKLIKFCFWEYFDRNKYLHGVRP